MNMPPTPHRISSRIAAPLLPLALAGLPLSAFAQGLPTMEDPSRGQGSGILQTLQNYGYDIVLLIALAGWWLRPPPGVPVTVATARPATEADLAAAGAGGGGARSASRAGTSLACMAARSRSRSRSCS